MDAKKSQSRIFLVLGMHKSGTTLVSKLLMEAGVHMGSFDMSRGYDEGNQLEMEEAVRINKKLLGCAGAFSLDVHQPLKPGVFSREDMDMGRGLAETLCRHFQVWGFKDPRTCLTYPYWENVLPSHDLIMVYRDPAEVVSHYFGRRFSPATIWKAARALECWEMYNAGLLEILKKRHDAMILNYGALMEDSAELRRLQAFLGSKIKDSRDPDRYRSKKSQSPYYLPALVYSRITRGCNPLKLFRRLESLRLKQKGPGTSG